MDSSMLGFPVHHQLPEITQIHVLWVGDANQPSHLLLAPSPSSFNLFQHQGLFKWVSSFHQVSKVLMLSFSFSISPFNEYSGLISFRIDWLDLLAVQGTVKSLLQHHSSKASILWHSAFSIVQLSLEFTMNTRVYMYLGTKSHSFNQPKTDRLFFSPTSYLINLQTPLIQSFKR